MEEKEKMKVTGKAGKEKGHYNNMNFYQKYSKLVMNFKIGFKIFRNGDDFQFKIDFLFFVFMIRILLTTSQKSPLGFRAYYLFSFWTKVFNFDVHYFDCTYKGMSLFISPLMSILRVCIISKNLCAWNCMSPWGERCFGWIGLYTEDKCISNNECIWTVTADR